MKEFIFYQKCRCRHYYSTKNKLFYNHFKYFFGIYRNLLREQVILKAASEDYFWIWVYFNDFKSDARFPLGKSLLLPKSLHLM